MALATTDSGATAKGMATGSLRRRMVVAGTANGRTTSGLVDAAPFLISAMRRTDDERRDNRLSDRGGGCGRAEALHRSGADLCRAAGQGGPQSGRSRERRWRREA